MSKRGVFKADDYPIRGLLDLSHRFAVPVFQRTYSWERKKQLKKFADDLTELAIQQERDHHFFGSIVVRDVVATAGGASYDFQLIDGQQRTVTIALALAALAIIEDELNPESDARDSTYDDFLMLKDKSRKGQPRIRVTYHDRTQFASVIKALRPSAPGVPSGGQLRGNITEGLEYLTSYFRRTAARHPDGVAAGINAYRVALLDQVTVVLIILGDDDDPYQVFQSLNEGGKPLELLDLVRSNVLGRVEDASKDLTNFYEREWRPVEDQFKDPAGGRRLHAALEQFLFPYALSVDSSIPKNRAFSFLVNEYWANDLEKPDAIVDDIVYRAPAYLAVHPLVEDGAYEGPLSEAFARLRGFGASSSTYPFLMNLEIAVREGRLSAKSAIQCISWVEAFLVRRAVRGVEPTGLHVVFKEAWNKCEGNVEKLSEFVRGRGTVATPSDHEFEQALMTDGLYGRRTVLAPLLLEYERHDAKPKNLPWQLLSKSGGLHVDHVMPRSRKEGSWPGYESPRFDDLVNRLGNLVLLEPALNIEKSNRSWGQAREELAKSDMVTSRKLAKCPVWDEDAINRRAEAIAKWALERFSYPG
jgi:hypothetical protein